MITVKYVHMYVVLESNQIEFGNFLSTHREHDRFIVRFALYRFQNQAFNLYQLSLFFSRYTKKLG